MPKHLTLSFLEILAEFQNVFSYSFLCTEVVCQYQYNAHPITCRFYFDFHYNERIIYYINILYNIIIYICSSKIDLCRITSRRRPGKPIYS